MEQVLTFFFEYKEAIFIIALSIFVGIEVISNVPAVLHTPLMSGANAISGVIVIGGIILLGHADLSVLSHDALFSALPAATSSVWMSHGDLITKFPQEFKINASNI